MNLTLNVNAVMLTRRDFIRNAAMTMAADIALPRLLQSDLLRAAEQASKVSPNDKLRVGLIGYTQIFQAVQVAGVKPFIIEHDKPVESKRSIERGTEFFKTFQYSNGFA